MRQLESSRILTHEQRGAFVIAPAGEFDVANVEELHAALETAPPGDATVVLDLADTTFVDAAVLGLVAATAGELQRAGRRLVLAQPRAHVRRLLRVTGLDAVITVYGSVAQAVGGRGPR